MFPYKKCVTYCKENISKQIEIFSILIVILSIALNKSPWLLVYLIQYWLQFDQCPHTMMCQDSMFSFTFCLFLPLLSIKLSMSFQTSFTKRHFTNHLESQHQLTLQLPQPLKHKNWIWFQLLLLLVSKFVQKSFQLYKIDKIQDSEDSCLKFLSFLTLINFGFAVSKDIYVFSNKFYKKASCKKVFNCTKLIKFMILSTKFLSSQTSFTNIFKSFWTMETQKLNLVPVTAAAI